MKVGIIGAGNVGVGVLDSLVYLGIVKEIILFNRTLQKAEGKIFDLEDSLPFLDSIRLQEAISKELGVSTKDIHAYVIGEHGDSEFVLWFMAMAGCVEIDKIKQIDKKQ